VCCVHVLQVESMREAKLGASDATLDDEQQPVTSSSKGLGESEGAGAPVVATSAGGHLPEDLAALKASAALRRVCVCACKCA
jgi:hypothetical protein